MYSSSCQIHLQKDLENLKSYCFKLILSAFSVYTKTLYTCMVDYNNYSNSILTISQITVKIN